MAAAFLVGDDDGDAPPIDNFARIDMTITDIMVSWVAGKNISVAVTKKTVQSVEKNITIVQKLLLIDIMMSLRMPLTVGCAAIAQSVTQAALGSMRGVPKL